MRVLTLLLLLAPKLFGAVYFVHPTTGNDANAGTEASPWKTIDGSMERGWPVTYLQPGDTLVLRGGLYSGNSHKIDLDPAEQANGTSNAPITIMAYTNERPIICDMVGSNFIYYPVVMKGKSWWVFNGLTWSNNYGAFYLENVTNLVITNCVIGYSPTNGVITNVAHPHAYSCLSLFGASQLNKIQGNTFTRWGMIWTNPALSNFKQEGSPIVLGNETSDDHTWYNLIENNRLSNCGHDLMTVSSGYNVIRGNDFHNEGWIPTNKAGCLGYNGSNERTNGIYGGLVGARLTKPGDAGDVQLDQRNVWEGNRFHHAGEPLDSGGAFGIELATQASIYRSNTVAFTLASGIYINTSGATTQIRSNCIYGNVIAHCGIAYNRPSSWMRGYCYGMGMNTYENRMATNFIKNNIIVNNAPGDVDPSNLVWQVWGTNWITSAGDPKFVSTNGFGDYLRTNGGPDFRVQSNSPCIDKGDWLTVTTNAGSGSTLPVLNAHWFSDGNRIVQGDTIQLAGSTNRAIIVSNDWTRSKLHLDRSMTWTNGQGVSLAYSGAAPDFGLESAYGTAPTNSRPARVMIDSAVNRSIGINRYLGNLWRIFFR